MAKNMSMKRREKPGQYESSWAVCSADFLKMQQRWNERNNKKHYEKVEILQ